MAGARGWLKDVLLSAGRHIAVAGASSRVLSLCYHSVSSARFASTTPERFEEHLRWLQADATVARFSDIALGRSEPGGRRPVVAVTFDDGYADNYEWAFPLLERYNVPATFFVTTGFVDGDPAVAGRLERLWGAQAGEIRPLTWDRVREMRRAGMEFGAHTHSHPNLSRLDARAAEAELARSKATLEARLGERVDGMAYPFGIPRRHFTPETMRIAAAAGYAYAAAIMFRAVRRSQSPYAVPRFPIQPGGVGQFEHVISGASDLLGVWQERAPVALQQSGWDRDA